MRAFAAAVAAAQGVYYAVTGLWPLVSIGSFQRVTGPKTDLWLARLVGLLTLAIGITLMMGSRWGRALDFHALGLMAALAYAAIDLVYAAKGVIRRIYLADAVIELALVAGWLIAVTGVR